jgi:hypothetical protein
MAIGFPRVFFSFFWTLIGSQNWGKERKNDKSAEEKRYFKKK